MDNLDKENTKNDFSIYYGDFWKEVKDLVDEDGWVYERDSPRLLDAAFENWLGKEIDYQKSFSFISGDNPNWTTRGARWRPKELSIALYKS